MSLRKMKSKFFSRSDAPPPSMSTPASNSQRFRSPPPMPAMPAITELRIAAPTAPKVQKVQKPPVQTALITSGMIRELRELIRYRYALDCRIWSLGRKLKWYQRDTIKADMRRADAALAAIQSILHGWDRPEFFKTPNEYDKFKDIKDRILQAQTRNWSEDPPWPKEDDEAGVGDQQFGRPAHSSHHSSMTDGRYTNGY